MDALRPVLRQYRDLFRSLSVGQRAIVVAVPLLIAAVLAVVVFRSSPESHVPLTWGKEFNAQELVSAEQALIDAGLTGFRREGRRLLVPAAEVERYNAALLERGSLPSNYAEELERQLDKQSIFTSERQSQAYRDLALKKELQRIIRAIPDVEDADVVWARGEAGRWPNRGGRVTATVSVRLRRNQELSPSMVQSLRTAVASMVPDLKTADVVVFDLKTGTSHVPGREGDAANTHLAQVRELTQSYQQKISEALSYIPGVLVTVNVDASRPSSEFVLHEARHSGHRAVAERNAGPNRPRALGSADWPEEAEWPAAARDGGLLLTSFEAADAEFFPARPFGVQVSVKIPEDYYRAIALKRGLRAEGTESRRAEFRKAIDAIRIQEEKKAQATATVLIPAGSPAGAVAVSSFVPVGMSEPQSESSAPKKSHGIAPWGSAIGLGAVAFWTMWIRRRTIRGRLKRPTCPSPDPALSDALEAGRPSDRSGLTAVADGSGIVQSARPETALRREAALTRRTADHAVPRKIPLPTEELPREKHPAVTTFDDLLRLDEQPLQRLLKKVETSHWAVALKGASEELRRRVFHALPPRAAELIEEEMESIGPVRLSDIDAMQQHVIAAVRNL